MKLSMRRGAALFAALMAVVAVSGPAYAAPLVDDAHSATAVPGAAETRDGASQSATVRAPKPCVDRAFRLIGAKWHETYAWSFRKSSTPKGLDKSSVSRILQRSLSNITNARNDCGRPDRVSATHEYLGTTQHRPNCNNRDGHNVVGFGRLQFGVLAVTCYWIRNGRMVEADLKINSRESWATAMNPCRFKASLEAVITHEAGHVFGLDHVGELRHGRLTMSPFLNGPCQNSETTLGLGDLRGLEKLY